MGLIATDINETVEYSLPEDQGEDRTIFILRALDYRERQYVRGLAYAEGDVVKVTVPSNGKATAPTVAEVDQVDLSRKGMIDSSLLTVQLGVKGWKNFLKRDGKPVPFEIVSRMVPGIGTRDVVKEDIILQCFRGSWISQISARILDLSRLDGEQQKN
jgi:hypothetical protein